MNLTLKLALGFALLAVGHSTAVESPHAVIQGPAAVPPGAAIFLDARKSVAAPGASLRWKLLDPHATLLTFDDAGRDDVVAILPAPEPGKTYRFLLIAVGPGEPGAPIDFDVAFHEVSVSPTVPSPPEPLTPPTPNTGKFGLTEPARAAVALVAQPPDHRATVARALAGSYRAVASQAAAGVLATPDAFLAANRESVRAVLHANLDAWKPALDALRLQIDSRVANRQLLTVADFADAWREIAAGLDAAAGEAAR